MPAQIPSDLAGAVARDGRAVVGTFDQAVLAAGGFSRLGAGGPGEQKIQTGFERLPIDEQARLAEGAGDPDPNVALVLSVTRDNFAGTLWIPGPGREFIRQSWHAPLQDGSPALLAASIDMTTSNYSFTVDSLGAHAHTLASDMFDSSDGVAGLGILRIVWPHRGKARAIDISVLRDAGSEGAKMTETRSYGARKNKGADDVDREGLTKRLLAALDEAYS